MDAATVYAITLANIIGFQYHPSNPSKNRMSVDECSRVAMEAANKFAILWEDPFINGPVPERR